MFVRSTLQGFCIYIPPKINYINYIVLFIGRNFHLGARHLYVNNKVLFYSILFYSNKISAQQIPTGNLNYFQRDLNFHPLVSWLWNPNDSLRWIHNHFVHVLFRLRKREKWIDVCISVAVSVFSFKLGYDCYEPNTKIEFVLKVRDLYFHLAHLLTLFGVVCWSCTVFGLFPLLYP